MQVSDGSELLERLLSGPAELLPQQIPLDPVPHPLFERAGIELWMKRDERLHPIVSGNKLYKLWGHVQQARQRQARGLCSYGGYYSNHLHALAWTGNVLGLPTLGFVRGHEPPQLSPTLQDCRRWGMELRFLSRLEYRAACEETDLQGLPDGYYRVPEGGGGEAGLQGCRALGRWLGQVLGGDDTLCVAAGTGTTLSGILQGLDTRNCGARVMAFPALKLGPGLSQYRQQIQSARFRQSASDCFEVVDESQFGGFGRFNQELLQFMREFDELTGISLDPVYTGKMLFKLCQLAAAGHWDTGQRLVVLHSGGLQGMRGAVGLVPTVGEGWFNER